MLIPKRYMRYETEKEFKMCMYDEAFTKDEMLEETGRCSVCTIKECSYCGAKMVEPQEREG